MTAVSGTRKLQANRKKTTNDLRLKNCIFYLLRQERRKLKSGFVNVCALQSISATPFHQLGGRLSVGCGSYAHVFFYKHRKNSLESKKCLK